MEIRRIFSEEINEVVKLWTALVNDQFQYDPFFVTDSEGQLNLKNRLHTYVKDNNYLITGAFHEAELVGYALAQISEHPPFFKVSRYCNLRHVFVKENYRNIGIGNNLVKYIKEWAKQKGVNRIELLVASENIDAIRFYHNHGFNNFGLVLTQNL